MKKLFSLFLVVLLLAAACQQKPRTQNTPDAQASAEPSARETAIAQVGPAIITQQQLDDRLEMLDEDDRAFAQTEPGRLNFIQLLVREKLATLDAKDKELDTSDVYLTALEDKRAQLKDLYEEYAANLLSRLWEDSLHENGILAVSDEEIAAYHQKYPYEMTIKQILISDAQTADAVYRELKRNKRRWKELEKKYSSAPERSRGKEFTFMPGEFIPELEVIAANSSVGSVQGFVKTSQGFHIIMKTGERKLSLQQAASRIRAVLENQKTDAALNALQNKYKVVIYEQND